MALSVSRHSTQLAELQAKSFEMSRGYPHLEHMASGAQALVLQPCTTAEFDVVTSYWVQLLQLMVTARSSSPEVRMLHVRVQGAEFRLATDVWLQEIALEPVGVHGAEIVAFLYNRLRSVQP